MVALATSGVVATSGVAKRSYLGANEFSSLAPNGRGSAARASTQECLSGRYTGSRYTNMEVYKWR